MDETPPSQVDPHMGDPATETEKQQIARLEPVHGYRKGVASLVGNRARHPNPHLPVGVLDQTAAVHAAR